MKTKLPIIALSITCILSVLTMVVTYSANPHNSPETIQIQGWNTYEDTFHNITFQYPSDWLVDAKQPHNRLLISPRDSEARLPTMQGDGSNLQFGITIARLNEYPALPDAVIERDLENGFEDFRHYSINKAMITSSKQKVWLVYDLAHDDKTLVAYKQLGGEWIQLEMGRNFGGNRLTDVVSFFGVLASIHAISGQP
jgi:hypothetical protein